MRRTTGLLLAVLLLTASACGSGHTRRHSGPERRPGPTRPHHGPAITIGAARKAVDRVVRQAGLPSRSPDDWRAVYTGPWLERRLGMLHSSGRHDHDASIDAGFGGLEEAYGTHVWSPPAPARGQDRWFLAPQLSRIHRVGSQEATTTQTVWALFRQTGGKGPWRQAFATSAPFTAPVPSIAVDDHHAARTVTGARGLAADPRRVCRDYGDYTTRRQPVSHGLRWSRAIEKERAGYGATEATRQALDRPASLRFTSDVGAEPVGPVWRDLSGGALVFCARKVTYHADMGPGRYLGFDRSGWPSAKGVRWAQVRATTVTMTALRVPAGSGRIEEAAVAIWPYAFHGVPYRGA